MNIKKDTLKFYFIVIYVLSGTYIVWFTNGKSLIGVDDANIYMVYMQNFANGHGFVFNIGGEKVEGFTSLLWTLIGSVAFYITQKPEIILLAINIIIISFTLWKLVCFIDRYLDDTRFLTPSSLFLLGGLILIPGYFEWTVLSLLETGLWSSLLILISLNLLDDQENKNILHNLKFYTLIILLVLCRPESMLWVLWFIVAKFFKVYIDTKSIKKSILQTISAIVVFSVTVVSLILWREAYFGFPLPNTFYAKITSNWIENAIEGLKYIIYCFSNNPLSILSLLLAIGLLYPL
uniref:hypothetical protein n=1 Tax=Sulfurovum sp. TaxID=1969726 RepID=UPI0025E7BD27